MIFIFCRAIFYFSVNNTTHCDKNVHIKGNKHSKYACMNKMTNITWYVPNISICVLLIDTVTVH